MREGRRSDHRRHKIREEPDRFGRGLLHLRRALQDRGVLEEGRFLLHLRRSSAQLHPACRPGRRVRLAHGDAGSARPRHRGCRLQQLHHQPRGRGVAQRHALHSRRHRRERCHTRQLLRYLLRGEPSGQSHQRRQVRGGAQERHQRHRRHHHLLPVEEEQRHQPQAQHRHLSQHGCPGLGRVPRAHHRAQHRRPQGLWLHHGRGRARPYQRKCRHRRRLRLCPQRARRAHVLSLTPQRDPLRVQQHRRDLQALRVQCHHSGEHPDLGQLHPRQQEAHRRRLLSQQRSLRRRLRGVACPLLVRQGRRVYLRPGDLGLHRFGHRLLARNQDTAHHHRRKPRQADTDERAAQPLRLLFRLHAHGQDGTRGREGEQRDPDLPPERRDKLLGLPHTARQREAALRQGHMDQHHSLHHRRH